MTGESLYPRDLIERLRTKIDEVEAAVIRYRDGHDGPCLNYEGQDPAAYDEFEPCAIHVLTARATPFRDVAFGLRTIQAHRKIAEIHYSAWSAPGDICFACDDGSGVEATWPCATLRALASIYFPESETS